MIESKVFPSWIINTDNPTTVLVVDSVLLIYKQFFSVEKNVDCSILFWDVPHPMCCPRRSNPSQKYTYHIYLYCRQNLWARMIYQLSHEVSHLFMQCYPSAIKFKWISECLCESASMFILKKLSALWLNSAYINLTFKTTDDKELPYALAILNYLENLIQNVKKVSSLKDFFNVNREWFASDPNGEIELGGKRHRNNIFAYHFFELMCENPSGWSAITWMSDDDLPENADIIDYFRHWENRCISKNEKAFVTSLFHSLGL